ncbi:cytochrome c maturation protein CcmE [Pleionea sp. CnH1-48]|uniref:cytochrome c maturation protein CcmE n=1 Tax=Pleionea sp. CnH1-48 TaxID=2954494 RepID=UPI002097C7E3|nr:cytochrome c maturation protein CcmE [Pleionea sp. CnH1-48]MCO7223615.1 cytochrome c maturation protein CcmE [Pleionea sp. CnH1-48]
MKAHRQQRLIAIIATIIGVAIALSLVIYALGQNVNLFYSPAQIAAGEAPIERTIKVGGLVLPGSVNREEGTLNVAFTVSDNAATLRVHFSDILPDLFKEGQGIVATGMLMHDGSFKATSVLAKHDENYMPPEVAKALEKAGHPIKK